MDEQLSNPDQSADTSGSNIFLSVDLFDELMMSLARAYTQLCNIELIKLKPDPELFEKYAMRHHEILLLKESFPINAVTEREKVIESYSLELKQIRRILQ